MPQTSQAIVFDDGGGKLSPLTDLRAAFDIRTGAGTTLERLLRGLQLQLVGLVVPPAMADLTRTRHKTPVNPALDPRQDDGGLLIINGRCVLPMPEIAALEPGQTLVEASSGDVIAHRVAPGQSAARFLAKPKTIETSVPFHHQALLARPWHFRTFRDRALNTDLIDMATLSFDYNLPGLMIFGEAPVRIAPSAKLYPGIMIDVENGPVVIDEGAVIRPACTIIGPTYIGKHSTVLDRALIKANTAIGPQCKVAGEVGGTIFQGFANKAHDGHLGDAWVGEWANLGAGTTNSNLLNTYGDVVARATPDGPLERTGLQFLGCVIGDHVKTAICTRIMTGAILGTGTMYAASAAANGTLPPYGWVTDESPPGKKFFRMEKFLEIAQTVMARRKVAMDAAYSGMLRRLLPGGV